MRYLFFVTLITCLLCLISIPVSVYSQNLPSSTPPSSSVNSYEGASQENEFEDFLAQFNGCNWYRTPHDTSRDVYFELKGRNLILHEYLKDESYCLMKFSSACFVQLDIWRTKVDGYDTMFTDRHGNVYRIAIDRNGKTIIIHSINNEGGGMEYIVGTFVKLFCSDNI